MNRQQMIDNIKSNEAKIMASDFDTKKVMREETELILNKERTIFNILTVATIITVIITYNI